MPIQPGTRVGPYEITGAIGAGGMGEVYRAHDTKLNRVVAIKVLPELFALDRERVARFEREAQSLAAMNHPNIAQVFGALDAPPALVMEFVDGEDLAGRITRGAIPLDEGLLIARQIAEAVEAAHERGIIHRDLKPANIRVRRDGTVKVLDFGLAKAMDPRGDAPPASAPADIRAANSPTFASPAMTQRGVLLGTAAYMAPEQAKGQAVDKRADIWAFGCVVYEMLTGVSAFAGASISEVIAAVLTQDVDWRALPADTPPSVRRLLERCLQRDPRRRLRDIGDAVIEIDAAAETGATATARRSGPGAKTLVAGLAAAILLTVVATTLVTGRRQAPPAPTRAALIPDAGFLDFSTVAVSPDGAALAIYRDRAVGGGDLVVHQLDGFSERIVVEKVIAVHPFFSPKGDELAFSSNEGRAVFRVSLSGGAPTELVRVAETLPGLWLDDDSIIVTSAQVNGRFERGLSRVPARGDRRRASRRLARTRTCT